MAKSKKIKVEDSSTEKPKTSVLNEGKCCSCKYYPRHVHGQAMPCKKLNAYVARKAEHPCWTAK